MKTQVLQHLYSKYFDTMLQNHPPPSLNFDPGDFKGTGHKFNLMFQTLQICR